MADKFARVFGSFLRRIVDMGDGTWAERVVAAPPADMVSGDRMKVELDEPIAVTLPASPLPVHINDQPIAITHPANLVTGTTKPRLRVDVGQTGFFEKREFELFREFATATTATYVMRVVSPVNFILQDLAIELEAGSVRLATFQGGTPTGSFSETLPYIAANTMTETPAAYTPQIVITAIPTGGSLAGGTAIRVTRVKSADNSNFASSVGSTPDLVAGRAPGTYYLVLQLNAAVGVLKGRIEERP